MANILVVDDHVDTCKVLVRLLRHLHHQGSCIHSGEAALKHLGQQPQLPDLLILDVMMPGMDGMEVLRNVRADARMASMPVVMFSAVTDSAFREHALSKGATDYWAKAGLDFAEIEQKLRKLLPPDVSAQSPA